MVKIAMVGVGAISEIYLKNFTETFRNVEVYGLYDIIPERAEKGLAFVKGQQEKGFSCATPKIYKNLNEVLNDPEVSVIMNLTRPYEHYEISKAALEHGKHVYTEKPLGVDMEEATELINLAKSKNLLIGGAPDTFFGAGIQTVKKLIDDGVIGEIIGADCAMRCRGHESWHPDPEFYYKRGGGPGLDMGPYYVNTLCYLLGEAKGVMGMTKKSFSTRTVTSQPHNGTKISVDIDTHLTGSVEFSSGAMATVVTTFDVFYPTQARFEIYGSEGTIIVPDPNYFGGVIQLFKNNETKEIPLAFEYSENKRGIGLADMVNAIENGGEFRANGAQMLHVLEILTAFSISSEQKKYIELTTKYKRVEGGFQK